MFSGDRSDFYFLSDFLMKFLCAKRIAYTVCLCPSKGTPGLYELKCLQLKRMNMSGGVWRIM